MGKKTLCYYHWVKNGVDFVGDLLDDNGNILTLDDFKLKYKVNTNFLEFGGLIAAIKKYFPNLFDSSDDVLIRPFKPFNFDVILKDTNGSRRIDNILVSSKKVTRKYVIKWENKVGDIYNSKKWSVIFNMPFNCTINTKLRWFQFRLIHRILGTNLFLFKICKNESGLCTFCSAMDEALIHLFCSCNVTTIF